MGGCEETVRARCCLSLATNVAFTSKVAAWSTAQASGEGHRRPLVTLRNGYRTESEYNETEYLKIEFQIIVLCAWFLIYILNPFFSNYIVAISFYFDVEN